MLETKSFGNKLKNLGFDFYSGVPCSFLKDLINYAINDCEYVMAANEGDAIAVAAGAYLAGRKSIFLCQNSGITNATSPLTSLNFCFRLPVLGFVSLRGEPGIKDEPQHELMGAITEKLLATMEIDWEYLVQDEKDLEAQLEKANKIIESNKSFFFVVKKGTFSKEKLIEQKLLQPKNIEKLEKASDDQLPGRFNALKLLNEMKNKDSIFLASTGHTGRELFTVEDNPNKLYMVGSMGCISSLALGLAMAKSDKEVFALDGDGAFLMRMGAAATCAYYHPKNLFHILLDNNKHASTGGQATISHGIDFVGLAASMAYPKAIYCHGIDDLKKAVEDWRKNKILTFAYLKINTDSVDNLGRPTIKPHEVKERLMNFIQT